MKRALLISGVVAAMILAGAAIIGDGGDSCGDGFNQDAWRGGPVAVKQAEVRKLVDCDRLDGNSRQDVLAVLGAPTTDGGPDTLVWVVGDVTLVVIFDERQVVLEASLEKTNSA